MRVAATFKQSLLLPNSGNGFLSSASQWSNLNSVCIYSFILIKCHLQYSIFLSTTTKDSVHFAIILLTCLIYVIFLYHTFMSGSLDLLQNRNTFLSSCYHNSKNTLFSYRISNLLGFFPVLIPVDWIYQDEERKNVIF